MFVEFTVQKKREFWLLSIFAAVLYALVGAIMGVGLLESAGIAVLLLLVLNLRLHFDENTPIYMGPLIAALFSFAIFCEIQLAVGTTIANISLLKIFLNFLIVYALVLFVAAACGNLSYALIGVQVALVLLGIANNLVVQTRGMELQFSDLLSIGTAATVAGDYTYTLTSRSVMALLLTVVQIFFFSFNRLPKFKKMNLRIGGLSTGTLSLILVIALVSTSTGAAAIGFELKSWKLQPSSYNGFLINLLHSVSATRVDAPDGYSREELESILNQYAKPPANSERPDPPDDPLPPVTQPVETEDEKKPNVIVIMNETFSDLTAISQLINKNMMVDKPVLPYFSSLLDSESNIAKGYAMASVFGGNTANSEFEFLTSNSMAFLPANTVAYNLYLDKTNSFSVVDLMNAAGYRTIGMHPEVGTNWKRNQIYSYYGFDETYFLESDKAGASTFVNGQKLTDAELYRGHVSDSTIYNRIIELYENKKEDEALFTFAITMQNHGGYTSSGFEYGVHMGAAGGSPSVDEYLTTVQNSDAALQELLNYFTAQEEETLIVFFGDHQPSLPSTFYSDCWGLVDDSPTEALQAKYAVPYLYWGNFDFDTEFAQVTSINYLASHMLDIIDVDKTRYYELLDAIEAEVPAINSFGWWDTEMKFHAFNTEDSDMVQSLRLYKYLQYNRLFDLPEDKLTDLYLPQTGNSKAGSLPASQAKKQED